MIVYQLRTADRAIALAYRDAAEYNRQHDFTGTSVDVAGWSPPAVEIIRDGSGGTAPADVTLLGVEPAFSARAVERVGHLLRASGQLLPLISVDGEFYLWNVTTVVDALDEEASAVTRFSSGRIMAVERWVFRPGDLRDVTAFKIPQLRRAYTFITDRFAREFTEAGLAGLAPHPVWRQVEPIPQAI